MEPFFARLNKPLSESAATIKTTVSVLDKIFGVLGTVATTILDPTKWGTALDGLISVSVDTDVGKVVGNDTNQDYLARSNGTMVSFTTQDDVLGIKAGGPVDNLLAKATGGGASAAEIGAEVAAALMRELPKAKLKVEGDPTFSGGGMNIGQYEYT
jgi:hypothetical protein